MKELKHETMVDIRVKAVQAELSKVKKDYRTLAKLHREFVAATFAEKQSAEKKD